MKDPNGVQLLFTPGSNPGIGNVKGQANPDGVELNCLIKIIQPIMI